jgi:hypothetical protein
MARLRASPMRSAISDLSNPEPARLRRVPNGDDLLSVVLRDALVSARWALSSSFGGGSLAFLRPAVRTHRDPLVTARQTTGCDCKRPVLEIHRADEAVVNIGLHGAASVTQSPA